MIRPEDCGPLSKYEENLIAQAEAETDARLKKYYDPQKHNPVELHGDKISDIRVGCHDRVFRAFIKRYEENEWECVWIANTLDGMSSPYLVARGHYTRTEFRK